MAESSEVQVLKGSTQFTTNLYQILAAREGNVIFSPISVHAVLSMAYQGAQGTTAEKLASALQVSNAKAAADGYNAIINRLNSVKNVSLLMANRVFLMEGATLLSDFSTSVTKNFLSDVQLVDFSQTKAAARTINAWVEGKTDDKIKDLIQSDDLDALTRLVLVNGIYFKGNWKHKFDEAATANEPFHLNDADRVDVKMMHIKKSFNYKANEALEAQILELLYTNEDLSMFIILPNKKNGIGELEKKLVSADLSEIFQGMRKTEVNVALPKFKIEQTVDLEDCLVKLGLGEIFDQEKANFKGMIQLNAGEDRGENLYVSKAVQKAFIEVNEEGAEAAAATGMVMMTRCASRVAREVFFRADHPFVFFLTEKSTETRQILFSGKIVKPTI